MWAAALSGVALRWANLGRRSLWYDEAFTARVSSLSPGDIVRFAQSDTYPPLYYFLEHYWAAPFGSSECALRALSAFCGTLSLPVLYLLAKKVLKDGMGVALAMWLFALSTMQIWYSREARFYGLLAFLSLVSLYCLLSFLEKSSALLFMSIVLSVTAGLYVHNMFFYWLALSLTWLIYPSERTSKQRFKELLLCCVITILLYMPWVPSLLAQVARVRKAFWAPPPTTVRLLKTFCLVGGVAFDYPSALVRRVFHLPAQWALGCLIIITMILLAALLVGGLWRVSKGDAARNVALLAYSVVPIVLVFGLSRISTSVYLDRVFVASSRVFPILLASPLSRKQGSKEKMVYGFLGIALSTVIAVSTFGFLRYEGQEDWRSAANHLLRISDGERLIVFVTQGLEIPFNYYSSRFRGPAPRIAEMSLQPSSSEGSPARTRETTGVVPDLNALKLVVESYKYEEIDLVLSHEKLGDPNGLALNYLNKACVLQEERNFQGIRVLRFLTPMH
jgi:hypothetical protein